MLDSTKPTSGAPTMADPRMPQEMIDWMTVRVWGSHHNQWHFERRWDFWHELARQGNQAAAEMVAYADAQGWTRSAVQEGAAGNGDEFLLMHRAMLQLLVKNFPEHAPYLRGWNTPPTDPSAVDDPVPGGAAFDPNRSAAIARIENSPTTFNSDDELGLFIETNLRPTATDPLARSTDGRTGLHNYLHNRWTNTTSDINLGDPTVNIFNARFWRLHGWIDYQWWRYRQAQGLSDTDPAYQQGLKKYRDMMDHPHHAHAAAEAAKRKTLPKGFQRAFIEG
jgi:hypothetical protein